VQYSLDKRPEDMWNFIVGSQYQINRNWMFRAEFGFLGSRTHLIAGAQYRFGL
jgi:long-subunit fatty acid transport protein